ncbi:hypothetical protein KX928_01180 [Roseobacter sp. YSTF-M11]|uniref:Uncharacterized protein n=1 Tax=Roseobacter insulae TaxID=2859783 RepID=A0A9X1K0E7_9RHOB|nr:hypothetical protein [Roseobacter insulae]MBW4706393.1 hypothetical protein [Roseobacter insulae]
MMDFNPEIIAGVVDVDVTRNARAVFGEDGVNSVLALINNLKMFFQRVPPESISGSLIVVMPIVDELPDPIPEAGDGIQNFNSFASIMNADITPGSSETLIVQFRSGGIRIRRLEENVELSDFSQEAVVYRYEDRSEWFVFGSTVQEVPSLSPSLPSNYCEPTAASLEEALDAYVGMVRTSKCHILKEAWFLGGDGPRLVLTNKPEHIMRQSLENHLSSRLAQGTNVRPEQNTDESHPVDLRVEWFNSAMTAIIEIKWLGMSTSESKDGSEKYTRYSASRARDGADQLAEYLDNEKTSAPERALRGYLVVFDARRKGVQSRHDRPGQGDATHYRDSEIPYDPDHAKLRPDFDVPRRFFLEPKLSELSNAN